jgi:hypothetical protein
MIRARTLTGKLKSITSSKLTLSTSSTVMLNSLNQLDTSRVTSHKMTLMQLVLHSLVNSTTLSWWTSKFFPECQALMCMELPLLKQTLYRNNSRSSSNSNLMLKRALSISSSSLISLLQTQTESLILSISKKALMLQLLSQEEAFTLTTRAVTFHSRLKSYFPGIKIIQPSATMLTSLLILIRIHWELLLPLIRNGTWTLFGNTVPPKKKTQFPSRLTSVS